MRMIYQRQRVLLEMLDVFGGSMRSVDFQKLLFFQTDALQKIRKWVDEGNRVALTCFERHPEQCHRHCVADGISGRFGESYSPVHL